MAPVAASATQIAADAGQFVVQAQLVQNACVPEFTEKATGAQSVAISVVLSGCALAPHAVSVEPSGNNGLSRVTFGQPVSGKMTGFGAVYNLNARFMTSSLTNIEPYGATLQVTYF